ncbi:hypothetical protein GCM10023232_15820 [Sphingosinicella ginsenosidimutans]|uniref:DUF2059 domain-containing protein n=1 Tax=Allosphingosinicella ginsenosidimutans TaxID=1176539 RepID=A0A5C6TQN7_9SPHN|nr:hypothetical protein [Sphingosinicella ginsenosidimutans]TXC62653.1 hypothetical protein FRZ32_02645 [Sphingosinicella ginsenosidimutans]
MRWIALLLAAALAETASSATPPPPIPPQPENLAFAVAMLEEHPFVNLELATYADWHARELTNNMLHNVGIRPGSRRWSRHHDILQGYLRADLMQRSVTNQRRFIECVAMPYAYLSMEQLTRIRDFLRTDAGLRLWNIMRVQQSDALRLDCARRALGNIDALMEAGWRAIGVTPPVVPQAPLVP